MKTTIGAEMLLNFFYLEQLLFLEPSAPTNLEFTEVTLSLVNVTWGLPDEPNGIILDYMVIYYRDSSSDGKGQVTFVLFLGRMEVFFFTFFSML